MAGLDPAIHVLPRGAKNVDARAFASQKRLRPRRRYKPGMTTSRPASSRMTNAASAV